jgi:hypothetical protein
VEVRVFSTAPKALSKKDAYAGAAVICGKGYEAATGA